MPVFSVFISVFNGEDFLPVTIDSLRKQSFSDFNVYLVDDESSDRSREIIADVVKSDRRFKLFCKKNEGDVPHSWCYILPYLDGQYVQYMSQDDVLEKDYFKKVYDSIQRFSVPDAVVTAVEFWEKDKNNRIDAGWHGSFDTVISGKEAFIAALDYSIPGFCCWKREIIEQSPIIYDAFNSDELMQRLWFQKCKTVAFSEALFRYRQNNLNAITKKFSFSHYSSLRTNIHLMESMLQSDVPREKIIKLCSEYYMGLFVLYRTYHVQKSGYSREQKEYLLNLFQESFCAFRQYARYSSNGIKRIIFCLSSVSFQMLTFITRILK